jgi:hypothetical protein
MRGRQSEIVAEAAERPQAAELHREFGSTYHVAHHRGDERGRDGG